MEAFKIAKYWNQTENQAISTLSTFNVIVLLKYGERGQTNLHCKLKISFWSISAIILRQAEFKKKGKIILL